MIAAALVDFDAQFACLFGDVAANDVDGFLKADVFVVAFLGLGGWGEDRLGQLGGVVEAVWQGDAADGFLFLVFLPAGAGEVAADDALDGERLGLFHDHRPSADLFGVVADGFGQRVVGAGEEVVGDDVGEFVEPVVGEHREHFALARDAVGQDDVVGADAVAGEHQEAVAEVEHFANLAAADLGDTGEIELEQGVA